MSELKACPWCGEVPEVDEHKGRIMSGDVTCSIKCDCPLDPEAYAVGKTMEQAIEKATAIWNTHPAPERHNELRAWLDKELGRLNKGKPEFVTRFVDDARIVAGAMGCRDFSESQALYAAGVAFSLTRNALADVKKKVALAEQAAPVKEGE